MRENRILRESSESSQAIPEQAMSNVAHVPLDAMVNMSTATHFTLVSPRVVVLGRDNAHIVASSHLMQLAAEVASSAKTTISPAGRRIRTVVGDISHAASHHRQ
jgi:hypothetical protein